MNKLVLFIIVLLISILFANSFGKIYSYVTNIPTGFGSFLVPAFWYDFFDGLPLSYIFFLPLNFTSFGNTKKYWWIAILAIPALAFELYFDLAHIYFPLALGLAGWVIGLGLQKMKNAFGR